jgi:hypothetical protein
LRIYESGPGLEPGTSSLFQQFAVLLSHLHRQGMILTLKTRPGR